ncbi:MAG: Tex family protein [Bacilli bacterium]
MNTNIIKEIATELNIRITQVEATLKLLSEGNTIPFISRYRKEVTGNLDEEQIRKISEVYEYQVNLLKRKEDVIRLIDEKKMLTEKIREDILICTKLVEVEDIYRPYKEKKKTKATDAIVKGLEPLAKYVVDNGSDIDAEALKFVNDKVKTKHEAIEGALYIVAEQISDNAVYRKWIRNYVYNNGLIISKLKKNIVDENKTYEMYYKYSEPVRSIKAHRVLALNRGEKEGVLSVSISADNDKIISYLENRVGKQMVKRQEELIMLSIIDSLKRLIYPSVEREIRSELSDFAEESAINNFGKNLESLLMQPPMKEKQVLALDPAYRTGCKLAVVDKTGKMIEVFVIYPHEPRNDYENSKKTLLDIIDKYSIDIIAVGNGTASRESEALVADVIKSSKRKVSYIIVNEAGASVYSASPLAIEEFPELHVEKRSAISLARRLQDPLSELVKIDPKAIGVGLYQHDVKQKRLDEALNFVVSKAVNNVGVNVNTASSSLLKYVSGLNKKAIDKIISYRNKNGKIVSREELKKILSDKNYEQSVGFIRVIEGNNPLDKTSIHPESYSVTKKLLDEIKKDVNSIGSVELSLALDAINTDDMAKTLETDKYTLEDIIKSLKAPNRDPRDSIASPLLKSDVLKIEDLKVGMKLQGTVRNVVDFGAFIDIGIKNDGLVHISKISNSFINHPSEVLSVGDIVNCYVEEIFKEKGKVSLSLLEQK